jgi:hypothetical protein
VNKFVREAKKEKQMPHESPLNEVKGFSKINFNKASRGGSFPFIVLEQLLQNIDVVSHTMTSQEGILHGADDAIKDSPHSVSKNF